MPHRGPAGAAGVAVEAEEAFGGVVFEAEDFREEEEDLPLAFLLFVWRDRPPDLRPFLLLLILQKKRRAEQFF